MESDHACEDVLTIDHLSPAEMRIVLCVRHWVDDWLKDEKEILWQKDLHEVGITPAASGAFNSFMTLLSGNTRRPIDVRKTTCRCMSQDEVRMLAAIAAAQSGDMPLYQSLLSYWMAPAVVRISSQPLMFLSGAMDTLRMHISPTKHAAICVNRTWSKQENAAESSALIH